MTHADTSALYSTVINLTAKTRFFGYLPPHGRSLTAGQQLSFDGDIVSRIHAANPTKGPRQRAALERDLQAGYLTIINTPTIILHDLLRDRSRELKLVNNIIVLNDPSWNSQVP